jgi:hypothetical protein
MEPCPCRQAAVPTNLGRGAQHASQLRHFSLEIVARAASVDVTGRHSYWAVDHPGSELIMPTPAMISEGATGPTVSWLRYLLVGRTLSDNEIDGIFGRVTKSALDLSKVATATAAVWAIQASRIRPCRVESASASTSQFPLTERWNGSAWSIDPSPHRNATSPGTLDGVSCASATACAALGYRTDGRGRTMTLAAASRAYCPTSTLNGRHRGGKQERTRGPCPARK